MRLIYVTSSLPRGTGEPFLIPEVTELLKLGHEMLVVPLSPRGASVHSDVKPLLRHMVVEKLFSPAILVGAVQEIFRNPLQVFAAVRILGKSRTLKIGLKNWAVVPKALWLAHRARRFGADHFHAHWGACTATMTMIASRVSNIPWSFTVHSWDIGENNLLPEKAHEAIFVRAISEFGRKRLQAITPVSTTVLHLGIEVPKRASPGARKPGTDFRIVVVGALLQVKGHRYLLDAWDILRRRGLLVRIDVVGDGALRPELERQVSRMGAQENIRFLGQVSHAELLEMISDGRWHAMVLPSIVADNKQQEGIPISLMEAMARGLPVISTRTGGIPELLEWGAGLLVPPKDPIALAEAIEAVATNAELHRNLRIEGRRQVSEQFAVEKIVCELVKRLEVDEASEQPSHSEARTA